MYKRFIKKLNELSLNEVSVSEFISSAVDADKRIYDIFNTNIKSLGTFCKHISVIDTPDMKHYLPQILKRLGVYDFGVNDPTVVVKRNFMIKLVEEFGQGNRFIENFFVFILSLDSEYNIIPSSRMLYDTINEDLIIDYGFHVKNLLEQKSFNFGNPLIGYFVLFGNKDLFDLYVKTIVSDEYDDIKEALSTNSMIDRRIKNCQQSSFKNEALLFYYYLETSNIVTYDRNFEAISLDIISKVSSISSRLELDETTKLTLSDDWRDKITQFLNNLTTEEKNMLIKCLNQDVILEEEVEPEDNPENIESQNNHDDYENTNYGDDVEGTTKVRRGQGVFKKDLIKSYVNNNKSVKCAIPNCNVCGGNFLIASHILAWSKCTKFQRMDHDNGLLLCPNHDKLFDKYYISFDDEGKIIFSEIMTDDIIEQFGLNRDIVLDFNDRQREYMSKHREKLRKR